MSEVFINFVDLASERLGASVIAASDEFFGAKERLIDPDEVERALTTILAPGQVTELRILEGTVVGDRWPGTYFGYFDNVPDVLAALDTVTSAKSIYVTLNSVDPALIARSANRLRRAGKGGSTSDKDITRRHWLLIDCDAKRPAGISANDEEHKAAIEKIEKAGVAGIRFAWIGETRPGGVFYYRVQGPTFVLEYDVTQSSGDHVHSVYRDLENDFGGDLLRKHYAGSPHHADRRPLGSGL